MAGRQVKVWLDPEGDYLEVTFDSAPGFFRATGASGRHLHALTAAQSSRPDESP